MPFTKGHTPYKHWLGKKRTPEEKEKISKKLKELFKNPKYWTNFKRKIKRSGYWYIYSFDHPFRGKQNYIAEHRLVMEKIIGRYLDKKEVVHHKNGIITDNRPENLQLFSSHGQHTKQAHSDIFEMQKITRKGKHFSPKTEFIKNDPRIIGNTYRLNIPSWNKGVKYSQEYREKLKKSHIGRHKINRTSFKKGMIPWNKKHI